MSFTEVFYNLNQLNFHQNISIGGDELKKENIVLTNSKYYESNCNAYYTVLQHPSNKNIIYMYYRSSACASNIELITGRTCLAISHDGGITFSKPDLNFKSVCQEKTNILFDGYGINHNFSAFYDPINQDFKGVGGTHLDSSTSQLIGETTKYKSIYTNKESNDRNIEFEIIPGKIKTEKKINGLFLLNSSDGIKWNIDPDIIPFIDGTSHSQIDRVWGYSKFDGGISVFYHPMLKRYFLYCRSNTACNARNIQMSTSLDLKKWDSLRLVNITPKPIVISDLNKRGHNDNYYYGNIIPYPNSKYFIGFPPYYNWRCWKNGIYLMMSRDGYSWKRIKQLIKGFFFNERNSIHSVNGMIESSDNTQFYIYMHENFWGSHKNEENEENDLQVCRYSIRRDGFTSLKSLDGEFAVKIDNLKHLYLNYRTLSSDGSIKVELRRFESNLVISGYSYDDCLVLTGDQIKHKVTWSSNLEELSAFEEKDILVYVKLIKAEVFSLTIDY